MKSILKKIKKERLKSILFGYLSFLVIYGSLILLFFGVFYNNHKGDNYITINNAETQKYGEYMVINYTIDGDDYQKIYHLTEKEINSSLDNFSFSYYKGSPNRIYVDLIDKSTNTDYSAIIILALTIATFFSLITIYYVVVYNKLIRVAKNGIMVETEVVKNIDTKFIVKWVNPEDSKTYYYLFYTKPRKSKWVEKTDKMYLVLNKLNYKEFYVVGKEMIA